MKSFLFPAAILISAAAVHAQEVRQVAFRTLCMEPLPGANELWLPPADAKGKALPVPVFASALSPVIEGKFKGGEAVLFSKAGDPASAIAKGKLATSKRQVLFLVPAKDDKGADFYEIRAFDDDTNHFKPGSVRAVNLGPAPVRFTMAGTTSAAVPEAGSAIFPPIKEVDEYGMYPVAVEVQGEGDSWTKVYSASWKTSERRREIVVVRFQEQFKQWDVRLMTDDPPWLK